MPAHLDPLRQLERETAQGNDTMLCQVHDWMHEAKRLLSEEDAERIGLPEMHRRVAAQLG